tara:strand:+ start:11050 stop:11985 length:936 start_codon:yes stop_codon:yes gene_type:complete
MYKRRLRIIQIPDLIYKIFFLGLINPRSIFGKSKFYQHLPFNNNEFYLLNNRKNGLKFDAAEQKYGKLLLKKMGVNGWYICFHSRDSSYLFGKNNLKNWSYHDYRDCDVKNYLGAGEYIANKGGHALRFGSVVSKKLPKSLNSKIIDYASKFRTDFGDVYLPANCKFFLSNTSGPYLAATMFDVPVAMANVVPLKYLPFRKGDLFIPKKIWSKRQKRFLTFDEIVNSDIIDYDTGELYSGSGLKLVENSYDEIRDLAQEMNERIDGVWKETLEDKRLQKKFWSLYGKSAHAQGCPARIGAKFLRENKHLLT